MVIRNILHNVEFVAAIVESTSSSGVSYCCCWRRAVGSTLFRWLKATQHCAFDIFRNVL